MGNNIEQNNKRIAKNTLLLYMRMFLIMIVSLFTSRVILQVLGVEDFGIYNVVAGVVSAMGMLNSVMTVATTRFITFELGKEDFDKLRKVFSMCLQIFFILSICFFLIAETLGLWFVNTQLTIPAEKMYAANWCYQFAILTCMSTLILSPYNAIIVAHEKMNIYAYISIADVILKLCIVYILTIIPFNKLITYGALFMLLSSLDVMVYYYYCTKHYKESRYHFFWDSTLFKQLMSYSWWNLFGSLADIAKGQGLNILLNMFFSPAVNAARGIAYQVNNAITQFFTNFYTAVRPQITKYYARDELNEMFDLVFRSSKFSFYLIYIISLPILIEAPYIIHLWLGQMPEYVIPFIRLIVITTAVDSLSAPLMTSAHATGRIKLYQITVGMLNISVLPISYIILKYCISTPNIVFFVSLFISILSLFARLWIVRRLMLFPVWGYLKRVLLTVLYVSLASFLLPYLVHNTIEVDFLRFILTSICCILSSFIVIIIIGLTNTEYKTIKSFVSKKLKKHD